MNGRVARGAGVAAQTGSGLREACQLAKALVDVVAELERGDQKPDRIDELVARHRARRLAMTLEHGHNGRRGG